MDTPSIHVVIVYPQADRWHITEHAFYPGVPETDFYPGAPETEVYHFNVSNEEMEALIPGIRPRAETMRTVLKVLNTESRTNDDKPKESEEEAQ